MRDSEEKEYFPSVRLVTNARGGGTSSSFFLRTLHNDKTRALKMEMALLLYKSPSGCHGFDTLWQGINGTYES